MNKVKYRHELKFILSPAYAEILKHRLAMIMSVDENSANEDNTYFIRSLYFDDCQDTAYYEKIDGIKCVKITLETTRRRSWFNSTIYAINGTRTPSDGI